MTLVLDSLGKRLGTFELPALDLTVNKGEYFVLLGPSGVGKTVLLELIAGLLQPDLGRISWNGRDITGAAPERREFAIVYQDYALFPHMTVRRNIAYGLRSQRLSSNDRSARLAEVAETMRIKDLLQRSPATLSGGEQQRVALARALVISPELILLDEPLSAVDLQFRRVLRTQLKQLHKETSATFLHVTHDVDEAVQLGQRIGVMLNGRIRQIGTPEELFQRPSDADVADFLGMRNILRAQPQQNGECLVSGVPVHVGERGHSYEYVWIRPEEILLSRERFESSARNQFECTVIDWEMRDVLVAIRLQRGELVLSALVTYASYEELHVAEGAKLFATFKSSAVHCF